MVNLLKYMFISYTMTDLFLSSSINFIKTGGGYGGGYYPLNLALNECNNRAKLTQLSYKLNFLI